MTIKQHISQLKRNSQYSWEGVQEKMDKFLKDQSILTMDISQTLSMIVNNHAAKMTIAPHFNFHRILNNVFIGMEIKIMTLFQNHPMKPIILHLKFLNQQV